MYSASTPHVLKASEEQAAATAALVDKLKASKEQAIKVLEAMLQACEEQAAAAAALEAELKASEEYMTST